jgi:hypothetical protein
MRWRHFWFALFPAHLLFLALVRFYQDSSWPGGGLSNWLTYQFALARCGPVGVHLCLVEVGAFVRGTSLLAASLTCVGLCAMYSVFRIVWVFALGYVA